MQALKELKSYKRFLNNTLYTKKAHCVFDSLAFISHTNFNYDLVIVTGHTVCANASTIVDPSVGCGWVYDGSLAEKIKDILKNLTKPDFKTDWYSDENFNLFWNYTFKYEKNVKEGTLLPGELSIIVTRGSFECKERINIGVYSDYV